MDVSNAINFKREWMRRRDTDRTKRGEPKWVPLDIAMSNINQSMIEELQKWSDENPIEKPSITRKEKLLKVLDENGFGAIKGSIKSDPDSLAFNDGCVLCVRGCNKCNECKEWWNEIIEDDN